MKNNYRKIMQDIAVAVAQAAEKIHEDFKSAASMSVANKASTSFLPDFVTDTDVSAQNILEDILVSKYPSIPFVGEEGCVSSDKKYAYFSADPLDGTSNFVALRDYFSCCVAYIEDGDVKASAIADPMRGVIAKSYKGGGVFVNQDLNTMNDKILPLISSARYPLSQIQLEYEMAMDETEHYRMLQTLMPFVSGFRKSGSTALDMVHIAMGRKMVLISSGLRHYDLSAGLLILREAGGIVTDLSGSDATIKSRDIVAASPFVHREIVRVLSGP